MDWRARRYARMSLADVFSEIYRRDIWSNTSGPGSDERFAAPYAALVLNFIRHTNARSVVDVGCGDFRVGAAIAQSGINYLGVDIVPDLIERNEKQFGGDHISFLRLDATRDRVPYADLCLIRQVFQHLSNDEIQKVIANCRHCRDIIVTEHIPQNPKVPNLDRPHGPDIRIYDGSGIFLDREPFSIPVEPLLDLEFAPGEILSTVRLLK